MNDPNPEATWSNGAPEKLYDTMRMLENKLQSVRCIDSANIRTYHMASDNGFGGEEIALALASGNLPELIGGAFRRRGRFNLLKSAIDSYCAMVVQVPSIDVTTTGGGWAQRRSAEALGLWVDGVFARAGMKGVAWSCVIDSCLARMGAVRVEDNGKGGIDIRRVLPEHILWNTLEGSDPRHVFTKTPVARAALLARHADDEEKCESIRNAAPYRQDPLFEGIDGVYGAVDSADLVELREGWRTSDEDGKGGRYVSTIQTTTTGVAVLDDEEYKLPMHCIVPIRYAPAHNSFAGDPAGDTLMHYQFELDEFAATIKEAFVKGAVLRVIVDKTAEVDEKELTDVQGQIIHKNPGSSVMFDRGTTLPPEYIAREEVMIRRAFEFLGLSYTASRGEKAPGLNSGKAIRENSALGQNRLVLNMQTIQDWMVQIAKVAIALADLKYEGKKEIEVKVPGSRLLRRVKWSEINYRQEDFEINCDAINALSRHPAARMEEILELRQALPNAFSERDAMAALGQKDLQSVRDTLFSAEDFAEKIIDLALSGDYRTPDPYMGEEGLSMLIKRGRDRYVQELVQKEKNEWLWMLRQLIAAAETELTQIKPPPAPPPAVPPGPPGAMPPPGGAPPDMSVPGAGLPGELGAAAAPPPVPGQGLG